MRNWFVNVLELFRKNRRGVIRCEVTNYVFINIVGDFSSIADTNSEDEIDETFELHIRNQAESLPEGWIWTDYEDRSGGIKSPSGESYFSYDINTMEYKIKNSDSWTLCDPYKYMSLIEFKAFAEEYIREEILKKGEKDEIRVTILHS